MKKAIIDQIMLWLVIFVSFVTLFFLVVDYYIIMKTKDRSDAVSGYGARMIALGKEHSDIISGLNNVKGEYFDTIVEDDLTCEVLTTTQYQVIFTTNITFDNRFLDAGEKIYSTSTAFNEISSVDQNCSLNLRR